MKEIINANLSKKDMFNAKGALGFKEAAKQGINGKLEGYAIIEQERLKRGSDEVITDQIAIIKVDGKLISGESSVIRERLKDIHSFFQGEEISIQLFSFSCGKGEAVGINVL